MERYLFLRKTFYFLELCDKQSTGSRRELVSRLGMSESSVKRMISDLRDAGIEIDYCNSNKSYRLVSESIFYKKYK